MASINVGRVVAGGLVAGVVANAIDFVTNTYILASDMAAWAPTRNLDPAAMNSGPVAATWMVVDVIFGLLVVSTYAAMRPRFGAGPKTAMLAGLTLWIAVTGGCASGLWLFFSPLRGQRDLPGLADAPLPSGTGAQ